MPFLTKSAGWGNVTVIIPAKGRNDITYANTRLIRLLDCPRFVIENQPYGEAIKQGIRLCNTEHIATMDADGQHTLKDLEYVVTAYLSNPSIDMMVGMRRKWTRSRLASVGLNITASCFAFQWVPDFGSGLRIFRCDYATSYLPILPSGFDFNAALTMCYMADSKSVAWYPIDVKERQWDKSSVRPIRDGLRTLRTIAWIGSAMRTRKQREWLRSIRSH